MQFPHTQSFRQITKGLSSFAAERKDHYFRLCHDLRRVDAALWGERI